MADLNEMDEQKDKKIKVVLPNEDEHFKEKLDTAFPLSGGEPDITLIDLDGAEEDYDEDENTSFKERRDSSFPSSGGNPEDEASR
jgi:hypothetical protein